MAHKNKTLPVLTVFTALCAALLGFGPAQATVALFEYGFEIDGGGGGDAAFFNAGSLGGLGTPISGVDFSAFDPGSGFVAGSGLGTVTVTLTSAGAHHVGFFVDHEIDELTTTFLNEFGAGLGVAGAGQLWELDDPGLGFIQGDLDFKDLGGFCNNCLGGGGIFGGDDVSMGLSHDFILAANELAVVSFVLGTSDPGGFRLRQTDSFSPDEIYFSSSLQIRSTTVKVPEPGAIAMFALGLFSIGFMTRRRRVVVRP